MNNMYLEKAIFINRAPFKKLELNFDESSITVLSAVNGKGKTTILSHIVDAFYEMARPHFEDFQDKINKYYRISSAIQNLEQELPSFVYFRFKVADQIIDYIDIRNDCTEDQYNNAITLEGKILFSEFSSILTQSKNVKKVSSNFNREISEKLFASNLLTYFPAYRYETPGYLNDPYKIELDFQTASGFSNYLKNPIEVITGLKQIVNWMVDVLVDLQYPESVHKKIEIDNLITKIVSSKGYGDLRYGAGQRGTGGIRLQVISKQDVRLIYPNIFGLSSGETALLCLFGELLRQSDKYKNNISLNEVTGIVLIDEIDKHLHIKLQKEILPKLLELFPNVQFIVSSHSPFFSMGLAETLKERAKIIDLDTGLTMSPTQDPLYQEVYEMMIGENEKFKQSFELLKSQINQTKELQIFSEGNNIQHIKHAIKVIMPDLLDRINFVKGVEDRTGDGQLKSAFEIMSKAKSSGNFLFVWDCDSKSKCDAVIETDNFSKFCFLKQESKIAPGGIENLYSEDLFTEESYEVFEQEKPYGEKYSGRKFSKNKFLINIEKQTDPVIFKEFNLLIEKIISIVDRK